MQVRLLIDHPYHGCRGTIVDISDKNGQAWIGNRIAEALTGPATEVANKKLNSSKVRKGTLTTKHN